MVNILEGAQSSAYKVCKDTAIVTITPDDDKLKALISKYFLNEKIPSVMGDTERLLFDEVIINKKSII